MWMKYKHKFSSGTDTEWSWYDLGGLPKKQIEQYVEDRVAELAKEYEWSEHYRGIDYELVRTPPANVVKDFVIAAKIKADYWAKRAIALKRLLKSLHKKKPNK